jgi:hypothetical protein
MEGRARRLRPPALTLAEEALVTVLRQRFRTPQHIYEP